MPGEEEKEEGHKFIEHLLMSEAFCPVHRDLVSLNSHMDPVRAKDLEVSLWFSALSAL